MAITVTLAGSYSGERFERMEKLIQELKDKGINVLYPQGKMDDSEYGFFDNDKRTGDDAYDFVIAENRFLKRTQRKCNAIIFCNYDGRLGTMSGYESYYFYAMLVTKEEGENPIPIYMTDEIDYSKCADYLGEIYKYGIADGIIKIGIDEFYKDFGIEDKKEKVKENENTIHRI